MKLRIGNNLMTEILSQVKLKKKIHGDILTEHKHKLYKVDKVFKIQSIHSNKYLQAYHSCISFNYLTQAFTDGAICIL